MTLFDIIGLILSFCSGAWLTLIVGAWITTIGDPYRSIAYMNFRGWLLTVLALAWLIGYEFMAGGKIAGIY